MFTIYHSNQANLFKKLLISIMSSKLLSNPMQSEIILTEHSIIDQWIQIELANHFGIACNITFMTLTSFIHKIVDNIKPDDSMMKNFSRSIMYWKFMKILSQTQIKKSCPIIEQYLNHDVNQQKISQFSEQLVNLFTQYLIYRPDWLNSWQSHKIIDRLDDTHQIWQSKIWRYFLENTQYTQQEANSNINPNPLQRCIYFLKNLKKINWNLPSRIFIFGITSIPPIYCKILNFLSYHIDIYLWFINSCYHNPDDISDQDSYSETQKTHQLYSNNSLRSSSSISTHIYNRNNHTNTNHPLLNSWNNTAHNTLFLFSQLKDKIELKSFIIPKKDSVLHIVQRDILEFHNCKTNIQTYDNIPISKTRQRFILTPTDQSITCHVCHSIQREIEVLHNNLLLMITNDPLLTPGDIIVMASDIHRYASAIQTVFNNTKDRHLPFNIADNHKKSIHPIISTFLNILNISSSRFTSEEILSFLTVPSIASRFNMNKEEIELLTQWIVKSGIRWGLDNFTMHHFNVPITNQNTWNFGLTRMLLGYAVKNQNKIWENILPYDDITIREHANIIGQLGEFLKTLKKWRDRLNRPYTLKKWIFYFKEIIDDFFHYDHLDSKDNKILLLLKDCCRNVLESGIQAEYTQTVSITALREKLCYQLHQNKIIHRFIPNVINFCDITPTFCIPCKIVCFLGMNDHLFPRNTITPDFNLITKNPRKNDDNIYEKDCYSFLLAFLIAQEQIYISFIEHSICDSTRSYPSTLINELFEYIALNFYLKESKNVEIDINIKYIRQRLCTWHNPFPFYPENFNPNSTTQSFAKEWLPAALNFNAPNSPANYPNFNTSLPHCTIKKIIFQDLYNFYRHPVRMWFQKRLNVYFDQKTLKLLNDEPFSVDNLNRYKLNTKLINYLIYDKNINELYYSVFASGILPYGAFGELFWAKQHSKMIVLANQIKEYHYIEKYNLDISLVFNTIELAGQLTTVQKNGLIRWTTQYLSMKDILLLWLEHITYCALGGKGDSRLFGVDDVWHFPNFSKLHAKKLLLILILGYCTGVNTPVLLLYQSGGAWMNHIFEWNTRKISSNLSCQKEACRKLIQIWKGTKYSLFRESHDPYLRKIIPFDLNEEDITKITTTAEHYFFNLMKYRIL